MNGLIDFAKSPYKVKGADISKSCDPIGDNSSEASSYVYGSHEDVLWSFEQQVNTMKKYGVVANSVEFRDLERSLDEELKRYQIYDEVKLQIQKNDTLLTNNTSELVHNGSESDSPPSSPDGVLSNHPSDIDKLYKKFYRENSIDSSDLQFRAPSDLDYYPTKQTPKVYPKSPTPTPKFPGNHARVGLNGSTKSYTRSKPPSRPSSSTGYRSRHSSTASSSWNNCGGGVISSGGGVISGGGGRSRQCSGAGSSAGGSQANLISTLPTSLLSDPLSGRHSQCSGYPAVPPVPFRKPLNTDTAPPGIFSSTSSVLLDRQAISPPLLQAPATRGYATSMPVLDSENIEPNKGFAGVDSNKLCSRTTSQLSHTTTRSTNISRQSLNKNNRTLTKCPELSSPGSSGSSEPELQDILSILTTSSNLSLVNNAAGALQHLSFGHDSMKTRIREAGAIPILVHMLSLDDLVCISSLGVLRNLSFGRNNHLNRIAIQDAHGVTLLVQLLNTTQSFEIQELVTGVFWNLSSSEALKIPILKQALDSIVKNIIIPQSGWKESPGLTLDEISYSSSNCNINWTTVFRNATGCLKNLSSAGLEGRTLLRLCSGLVDSLIWTVRSAQGKNDVDNKAVENSVCILRNLSYRLEAEVAPEIKYGQCEDWRSKGLGGGQFRRRDEGKRKKKGKNKDVNVTPLPEHTSGVGLLWQPSVVRVYLDLLLECSNPETLEGAAGALQNLTACCWEPAQTVREVVRKEKGLSVITSLLRMPNDAVVRATAFCLRNLALDNKNKDLLGKHATQDLVKRIPGSPTATMTDVTVGGVLSAIATNITDNQDNCRILRDTEGIPRILEISRSQEIYSKHCVLTANKILALLWEVKDIRRQLKNMGWQLTYYTSLVATLGEASDGMEYEENRNQLRISACHNPLPSGPNGTKSPDPTFDSHTMGRNHGTPDYSNSPLTTVTSSPSDSSPNNYRASNHMAVSNGHVPSTNHVTNHVPNHVTQREYESCRAGSLLRPQSANNNRNDEADIEARTAHTYKTLPNRTHSTGRYSGTDSWV